MYPIPANATRIRYLGSTGTQYIDTGIAPDNNELDFAIDFANEQTSTSFQAAFGCRDNTNGIYVPESYAIFLRSADQECRIDIANNGSSKTMSIDVGTRYVLSWDSDSRTLTKTVVDTGETATATASSKGVCEYTFALFGINTNGTISPGAVVRVYSARFYKSGVLVRDFVPLRIGSVGYLFDRVSGQLFGNAGTGDFVLGPDTFTQGVIPTRMMTMGAWRKAMKFIRSTGTYYPSREVTNNGSYLNTGINPDAQTSIEIICRVTPGSTFQHWAYLLGAQTANDNANTFSVRGLSTSQASPPWRNYRWGHASWQDFGITTYSWSGSPDWHTISINRSGLVLDGVLYSATGTTNTSVPGKPVFIGCINRNGTAQNCIPLDIASLKIWSGATLQFDGTPNIVNGVAGLKDSVSGSFFSSSSASNPYQLLQELAS